VLQVHCIFTCIETEDTAACAARVAIGALNLVASTDLRCPIEVRTLLRAILIRNRRATFST
jgi:hypothetical protein